jgi:hypothetical protein
MVLGVRALAMLLQQHVGTATIVDVSRR